MKSVEFCVFKLLNGISKITQASVLFTVRFAVFSFKQLKWDIDPQQRLYSICYWISLKDGDSQGWHEGTLLICLKKKKVFFCIYSVIKARVSASASAGEEEENVTRPSWIICLRNHQLDICTWSTTCVGLERNVSVTRLKLKLKQKKLVTTTRGFFFICWSWDGVWYLRFAVKTL